MPHLRPSLTISNLAQRMTFGSAPPSSHNWGYGRGRLEPSIADRNRIIVDLAIDERRPAVENKIQIDLDRRRTELLVTRDVAGFLKAVAFASCIQHIKSANDHQNSYLLKHMAQRLEFRLQSGVHLKSDYVSNTELIAAALYLRFRITQPRSHGSNFNRSPNVTLNMSQRSLIRLGGSRRNELLAP